MRKTKDLNKRAYRMNRRAVYTYDTNICLNELEFLLYKSYDLIDKSSFKAIETPIHYTKRHHDKKYK